jgi:arabinoxylan arabinofuranohydrolase
VYGGRVYLYNSNDDDNAVQGGYTMHSVVCVSSSDLKNWTDYGVVFQVPTGAAWAQNSWAPQPVVQGGTFFLYFGNGAAGVGVASSTSPTGGFKDAKGSALVDGTTPGAAGMNSWLFDPGVLLDDDRQTYLSFGGNGVNNARIIKLGSNLISVSGSAAQLLPPGFFEASFLFKRNGIYYFSYSTDPANGQRIDYMMSSSPMSGYTYAGILAGQPPVNSNNNHASEFEFNGQWYHAYHNRFVSTQAGIATGFKRNIALEVLDFNTDGTIKQVTHTTDGVPQVGNLNPYVRVEAETMNAQSGITTEPSSEGGMDVTQVNSGDWIKVRGVDFGNAGATGFSARVATSTNGGSIELRLGGPAGTLVGTCTVPTTGGPQTWMNTTCNVTGATGIEDLYLVFTGPIGAQLFNVDYWQFTGGDGDAGNGGGVGNSSGSDASTGSSSSSGGGQGTGSGASSGGSGASADASASSSGSPTSSGAGSSGGRGGASSSSGAGGSSASGSAAGTPDAGFGSGASPGPSNSGCGCGIVGGRVFGGPLALATLAFAGMRRRRRPRGR